MPVLPALRVLLILLVTATMASCQSRETVDRPKASTARQPAPPPGTLTPGAPPSPSTFSPFKMSPHRPVGPARRAPQPDARTTEQHPALALWERGGKAGPGYKADLLKVWQDGPTAQALYQKVRSAPGDPPYRTEEFLLTLTPTEKKDLLLLAYGAMERLYGEEKEPSTGDEATRFSLTLGPEPVQVKTFFGKMPPELEPLSRASVALMSRCESAGTRRAPPPAPR